MDKWTTTRFSSTADDVGQPADFPKNSGAIGICMLIFIVTNWPYLNSTNFAYLAYIKKGDNRCDSGIIEISSDSEWNIPL